MQKAILLLPLLCLVLCSADDMAEGDETDTPEDTEPSSPLGPSNEAGQIIYRPNGYPCLRNYTVLTRDYQLFNNVVCIKTSIKKSNVVKGDCPAGTATIGTDEVSDDVNKYCKLLGGRKIARIGFMGSLTCSGSNRTVSDFDTRNITHSICVEREIEDTMIRPAINDLCGEGQVLVTPQEALANQAAYCSLMEDYQYRYNILRLADGGSMDGPAYANGCKIRNLDLRPLAGVLCRNLKNN